MAPDLYEASVQSRTTVFFCYTEGPIVFSGCPAGFSAVSSLSARRGTGADGNCRQPVVYVAQLLVYVARGLLVARGALGQRLGPDCRDYTPPHSGRPDSNPGLKWPNPDSGQCHMHGVSRRCWLLVVSARGELA